MTLLSVLIVILVIPAGLIAQQQQPERPTLRELYTPTPSPPPPPESAAETLSQLRRDLGTASGRAFLRKLAPDQSGVLWLALIVALAVAFGFENIRDSRNLDLLAMQALGWCFFEVMAFFGVLGSATYRNLLDWVFTGVFAVSLVLLVRCLWRIGRPLRSAWQPNLNTRALAAISITLLTMNIVTALVRQPDDAGFFVNVGAQRLRERGWFPYGDPLLTGTPAAAYGPVLYLAHLPFQLALAPDPVNSVSPDRPELGPRSRYYLPPMLATKLCTSMLHVLGVLCLFMSARRLGGARRAWGVVALYCGSAYVMGVGGQESFIGGMTFVSHIAPPALTLAAFAALTKPALSGALLALAAGAGFYPAFMAPAWLGFYWWRGVARWQFVIGFALVATLIAGAVLLRSRPAEGRTLVGTILHDTFGHHTDPRGYGSSPFGFWGQREGLRAWIMRPLLRNVEFSSPAYLTFLTLVGAAFLVARTCHAGEFALLSAAIAMASALLKVHSTGTYVAWYYPFLLLGLFSYGELKGSLSARPAG